jgi:hypothetical protein
MAYEAAPSSEKKRRFKQVYAASEPGDRDRYRNVRQGIRRRGAFDHSAPVNSDLLSFPSAIPFTTALASPAAKAPIQPSLRFNHLRRRPQPKFVWELHFCPAFLRQSEDRMARLRSWQEIKQGSRWVDLTEGECATGAKRSIPPTSLRLKAPYGERIAAFLQHATVTQAQSTLISRGRGDRWRHQR